MSLLLNVLDANHQMVPYWPNRGVQRSATGIVRKTSAAAITDRADSCVSKTLSPVIKWRYGTDGRTSGSRIRVAPHAASPSGSG
jgi:hypothetical protein